MEKDISLWRLDPAFLEQKLQQNIATSPFPAITDRGSWESISTRKAATFDVILERATEIIREAVPPLPASLFLECERSGEYYSYAGPRLHRRAGLAALVLAECFENRGRFLDGILDRAWAICEESTWAYSAHAGGLPDIEQPLIDLGSAHTALDLAETLHLLGDRLPRRLKDRVKLEVDRRCITPFLTRHHWWQFFHEDPHRWMPGNWIAACVGGVVGSALYLEEDTLRLAEIVSRGVRSLCDYILTFGADGGSTEGVGYWSFGFGNYALVSHLLEHKTAGEIDLLKGPYVEKSLMERIARFPLRASLTPGHFVSFSDCPPNVQLIRGHLAYLGKRFQIDELLALAQLTPTPTTPRKPDWSNVRGLAADRIGLDWLLRDIFWTPEPTDIPDDLGRLLPNRDLLGDIQWFVARTTKAGHGNLAVAVKGGHNNEMHNQNDVGAFIVHVDGESLIPDIGAGRSSSQYFGEQRYEHFAASSLGHSVPVVNGFAQGTGAQYSADIVRNATSEGSDSFALDLSRAYPEGAHLVSLVREVELDRASGNVKLRDRFRLKEPGSFRSNIVTFCSARNENGAVALIGSKSSMLISYDHSSVQAKIENIKDVDLFNGPRDVTLISFEPKEMTADSEIELTMSIVQGEDPAK